MQVNVTSEKKRLQRADVTVDLLVMLNTTNAALTSKLLDKLRGAASARYISSYISEYGMAESIHYSVVVCVI